MTATVGVGILSFQNRPMLEKCVNSLKKATSESKLRLKIVVWDNASAKYGSDNVAWLKQSHPDIIAFESPDNVYCTIPRNNVIEFFRKNYPEIKYLLFSDMDVIFYDGFLEPMVEKMERFSNAGIVGYNTANVGFTADKNGRVPEIMSICNLHRLESFDSFPNPMRPFDEKFKVYSFDSWMCQTLNLKGWYTYVITDRDGYKHIGGQIETYLPEFKKIIDEDVKYWQKLASEMSRQKPWELKSSCDYISVGNRLVEEGRLSEALLEYLEGIARFPRDPVLYYCLGNLYKKEGEIEKALSAYNNAIELLPNYYEAIYAAKMIAGDE